MAIVQSTDSYAIDKGGSIGFAGKYNTGGSIAAWGQIGGRKENSTDGNYASYMQFSTRANGGSLTEKMRISSAGKVGIGITGPNGILNVSDSSGFTTLVITDPTENASGEHWYFRNTGGNFYIGQSTDSGGAWDSLQARVTVLDGGNVGIGTTNPTSSTGNTLEIYDTNTPTFKLNDGNEYKAYLKLGGNDLEVRGSNGNIEFYTGNADGESSTERMRISSSGSITTPNGEFNGAIGSSATGANLSVKAWINANGTGTVATNANYNATLSDLGTGNYKITFSSAMSDANYSAVGMGCIDDASASVGYSLGVKTTSGSIDLKSTTELEVMSKGQDDTPRDLVSVNVAILR